MDIHRRCPAGHVSIWKLGDVVEYFDLWCGACNKMYRVRLLSDGSWIVQDKVTDKPWSGENPPDVREVHGP